MCVLECFLIGHFLVGDPLPVIYLFGTILLRSVHEESLLKRLHFENNIFVVSRSPRAGPFAFNHLETLVGIWFDYFPW